MKRDESTRVPGSSKCCLSAALNWSSSCSSISFASSIRVRVFSTNWSWSMRSATCGVRVHHGIHANIEETGFPQHARHFETDGAVDAVLLGIETEKLQETRLGAIRRFAPLECRIRLMERNDAARSDEAHHLADDSARAAAR